MLTLARYQQWRVGAVRRIPRIMKIAYIAHPVSGDVKGNIEKIIAIVRHINLAEPDTVPLVPYLADLYALDDDNPDERERGISNGIAIIRSGMLSELRLYGSRISNGMEYEIGLAEHHGIPIKNFTTRSTVYLSNGTVILPDNYEGVDG